MLKLAMLIAVFLCLSANVAGAEDVEVIDRYGQIRVPAADIISVRKTCIHPACATHDAIVFVHGIYGDDGTFKNGEFDWPRMLPQSKADRSIDIFRINYKTSMIAWLKRDVASMDEVVYSIFRALYPEGNAVSELVPGRYRSVNFIAHSLGGNVVSAFLHTVKSELGHEERARYGFVITLGTPVNGSQIANFVVIAKNVLGIIHDPLLVSLKRDNTFLRMLNLWRRSENRKADRFKCRKVNLYSAIEGASKYGFTVVSKEEAEPFFRNYAKVKYFKNLDHFLISKPASRDDELYRWVDDIIGAELGRLADVTVAGKPLCKQTR